MNKAILIGNLGRDPEMNYTTNGAAVTKFSIAVNRRTKGQDGEWGTETDWFNIVAWSNLAETCAKYLTKGSKVCVEGRITMRKYTGRDEVERTAVEIVISEMEMLSPKGEQRSADDDDGFEQGEDETPATTTTAAAKPAAKSKMAVPF